MVPTATFRILFAFLVLAHDHRRALHFNVTEDPTAGWTITEIARAFPWNSALRYLVRDRDPTHGATFNPGTLSIARALHGWTEFS